MDQALEGVGNTESYVDDILVYSRTFDEHLTHLTRVFERLDEAGLRLRRDKCRLGCDSVEFLGHWISRGGRSPLRSYVERVRNFTRPNTVTQLQRFLGTVNYYRCYIPRIASTAEPLYSLTKKRAPWVWNDRCEQAFQELRSALSRGPVTLSFPDWTDVFHVEADACSTGIGAVLGQLDGTTNIVRPLEYFSSAISPIQRNYSAGQLETWAIVAATRKWDVYLKGAEKVVVHSDHSPLKCLQAQKNPKPTFARWLMELQGLPIEIAIRPGSENCVADYLSRNNTSKFDEAVNSEESFEDRVYLTETVRGLPARTAGGQAEDRAITETIAQLKDGKVRNRSFKRVAQHMRVLGGKLYFQDRVVVPNQMRDEDIMQVHCQHHFGRSGTLHSLRKNFFWPKMGKDVTLPWSEDGHRYFLLMVDLFSRHIEIEPLKDQRAATLIRAFEHGWIYRGHGVPSVILSDQGSNVDGETFREFCLSLGVNKKRTSPYIPQSDGMSERNIGMVKQVIRCLQQDRHLDRGSWPYLLSEVSFHCNGMVNNSTQISPHMLTYGRESLSPLDAWCDELHEAGVNTHCEYVETLRPQKIRTN